MPRPEPALDLTRRHFFGRAANGLGTVALASLLREDLGAAAAPSEPTHHFRPTAKRVIYLFQSGAPSQMDLFDHKPALAGLRGQELPDSVRRGQRLTVMSSRQPSFPIAPSRFRFDRHGESGVVWRLAK